MNQKPSSLYIKNCVHFFALTLILGPYAAMPVSVHAVQTESVVSYEEELAPPLPTLLVYNPIFMPDATIHNGAVAVNMFNGLSMYAFLTAFSILILFKKNSPDWTTN